MRRLLLTGLLTLGLAIGGDLLALAHVPSSLSDQATPPVKDAARGTAASVGAMGTAYSAATVA
jgi:hypothetical protein